MSKYIMELNKKYVVSTLGLTYVNRLVEVIGIVNYDEAKKIDDVKVTALNEKIIDSNYDTYFTPIQFYKCKILNDSDSRTVIIWSDIIDNSKTSVVGEKYIYKASIEIGVDTSGNQLSKDQIIENLITRATSMGATLSFTPTINTDNNTTVDILQTRLKEAENVIRSLQSLTILVPVLDSLNKGTIEDSINAINLSLDTVNERLDTIARGLS